jgi:hypothetical protein
MNQQFPLIFYQSQCFGVVSFKQLSLSLSLSLSATDQNFTHDHMNIFYNDQYYHLQKHCSSLLHHPV